VVVLPSKWLALVIRMVFIDLSWVARKMFVRKALYASPVGDFSSGKVNDV